VPGEGGDTAEDLANDVNKLELNGNDENENADDGGNADAKKKRRKRGKGGKGNKQTDPPTVPISQLFPEGN
jgi:methionyl aminopeptidase